ncbi:hypothetical protein CNR22_01950 [Sphingobacteriaceae bacterium]|nr:hypothetical protein CNR22_01950 [Sphingobacteriaceae bacterium]
MLEGLIEKVGSAAPSSRLPKFQLRLAVAEPLTILKAKKGCSEMEQPFHTKTVSYYFTIL